MRSVVGNRARRENPLLDEVLVEEVCGVPRILAGRAAELDEGPGTRCVRRRRRAGRPALYTPLLELVYAPRRERDPVKIDGVTLRRTTRDFPLIGSPNF